MKTNNIEVNGKTYDIESVEVRDNEIVLKRKQPGFKGGDVAFIQCSDGERMIGLLSDGDVGNSGLNRCKVLLGCDDIIWLDECFGFYKCDTIRHATESERQLLFDELRKQKKLKWNAEKMQLEKMRWRADGCSRYDFIRLLEGKATICSDNETAYWCDVNRYNLGNYFNPDDPTDMAEAQKICDQINALFSARI